MRIIDFAYYPAKDRRMKGIAYDMYISKPYHFSTIFNDDNSYKQCGTHAGLEIRLQLWKTIFSWTIYYKRITLLKRYPYSRKKRIGAKHV